MFVLQTRNLNEFESGLGSILRLVKADVKGGSMQGERRGELRVPFPGQTP